MSPGVDKKRDRALAIAKHVGREGPVTLPGLARTFSERGYHPTGFIAALALALEDELIEADLPTWTFRGPR